jgi:MYXO-CTERM domain-containing protein
VSLETKDRMRYDRLGLCVLSLLAAIELFARAAPARACSPEEDLHAFARATPANGAVLIEVGCASVRCDVDPLVNDVVEMVDRDTGAAVPGTVIDSYWGSQLWIAFRPDEPLSPGHMYLVNWQPAAGYTGPQLELQALPEIEVSVDELSIDASLEAREDDRVWHWPCRESNGGECSVPAVYFGTKRYASLEASLDATMVPESGVSQLVVFYAAWQEGREPAPPMRRLVSWAEPMSLERFDNAADAYCYRIEVRSLIDDSLAIHEGCLEHELGELTLSTFSQDELRSGVAGCGGIEAWCTRWLPDCTDSYGIPGRCAALASACEGIQPVAAPEPTGGDAGIDDAAMAVDTPEINVVRACSASAPSPGSSSGLIALFGFAVGLRARRRRPISA